MDILLLSVGADGHIASLFPDACVIQQKTRSAVSVIAPKRTPERLTVTPLVIQSAELTFLFARGEKKGQILQQALEQPNDIISLPVRLVLYSI